MDYLLCSHLFIYLFIYLFYLFIYLLFLSKNQLHHWYWFVEFACTVYLQTKNEGNKVSTNIVDKN